MNCSLFVTKQGHLIWLTNKKLPQKYVNLLNELVAFNFTYKHEHTKNKFL